MDQRDQVIDRLRQLQAEHAASIGEGPGEAPRFIQNEQITRNSYGVVLKDALDAGLLTKEDLMIEGLPDHVE